MCEVGAGGDWLGGVSDGTGTKRVPVWRDLGVAVEEEAGGGRRATGVTRVVGVAAFTGGAVVLYVSSIEYTSTIGLSPPMPPTPHPTSPRLRRRLECEAWVPMIRSDRPV